ncbi:metallophosphoesterase [Haloimpatiens sp. FM7330]|uniref:metallophosphoesterase n=1 Tax=Haloimpatiens sp. FM7330 TaxID=3298610 RepID=UPI0036266DDA
MLIGVISDTHRQLTCISRIEEIFKDVDLIIHLGDNVRDVEELSNHFKCKIINVRGNCDFTSRVPSERIEIVNGKKILITHGDAYGVKYDLSRLRYRALEEEIDIVLFGHTHCSMAEYIEGIWYINPGSPSLPRNGQKSVAILKIENGMTDVSIVGI